MAEQNAVFRPFSPNVNKTKTTIRIPQNHDPHDDPLVVRCLALACALVARGQRSSRLCNGLVPQAECRVQRQRRLLLQQCQTKLDIWMELNITAGPDIGLCSHIRSWSHYNAVYCCKTAIRYHNRRSLFSGPCPQLAHPQLRRCRGQANHELLSPCIWSHPESGTRMDAAAFYVLKVSIAHPINGQVQEHKVQEGVLTIMGMLKPIRDKCGVTAG